MESTSYLIYAKADKPDLYEKNKANVLTKGGVGIFVAER